MAKVKLVNGRRVLVKPSKFELARQQRQKIVIKPQKTQKQLLDDNFKQIKDLESEFERRRLKAREQGKTEKEDRFRRRIKGLKKVFEEINKGNLVSVADAKQFAADFAKGRARKAEFKKIKLTKKEQDKKIAQTLFIAREVLKSKKEKKDIKEIAKVLFIAREVLKTRDKAKQKKKIIQVAKIDLPKAPKEQQISFLKVATRTTLTPKDKENLKVLVKKEGDNLTKKQVSILKNAPKDIATGIFEVGKEVFDLGAGALKGSFNFGRNLVKRYEAGEKHPLFNDISKLATGTISVATFVKNNPGKSASIIGLAVAEGKTQFGKAFEKNPVKTLTKTVLYLFPGTAIKGGAKTVKLSTNAVKSTTQAIRLNKLTKKVSPAVKGLTPTQLKKVNSALIRASKISNKAKQTRILKSSLNPVLKAREVKVIRGDSLSNTIKKVAGSKDIVKVIKKAPKKTTKKPFLKFKGEKVTKISEKALPTPKLRKARDTTKFIVVEGKKIKKITKKDFLAKQVKVKKVSKKQKVIDTEKAFKQELKDKGVIKKGGTTFIDLNAVNRIEKSTLPVKPVTRKSLFANKKGQVRFNRQVQVQINKSTTKIKKAKKLKNKKQLKKERKKLIKLKTIINLARIGTYTILLKKVSGLIKSIDNAIAQKPTPKKDIPTKAKTPAKVKTPAKAKGLARPPIKKLKTPAKPRVKAVKKVTKKPAKPIKKLRIKITFDTPKPRGTQLAFNFKYRRQGKVIERKIKLPENRALKFAISFIKRTPARSFELTPVSFTKQKDINKPDLKDFNIRKTKTALLVVEKPKSAVKGLRKTRKR